MRTLFLLFFFVLFVGCDLFEPADDIKPSITVNYPEDNMQLSIRDTIKVIAYDESGIKKVKCEVSDSLIIYTIIDELSPYELPISFLENHDQELYISCEAYDENNNKSDSELISIIINNDLNPSNGYHDGDEIFKDDILSLNQLSNDFSDQFITWENINNLNRITEIRYRNLDIDTIPNSIQNLSLLSHIEFINNGLNFIPVSIASLFNLKSIRFQNNSLTEIPDFIGSLINIEIIDFSENLISIIPPTLSNLSCDDCRLKILKLQNNELNYIDVSSFSFLEVLWLANNNLEDIDLSCNNSIWYQNYNQLSPAVTLSQNYLCDEPSEYGECIDDWEIGVQNCD